MKERQAEVYFGGIQRCLSSSCAKEVLLRGRLEAAGWLPLLCAACFSSSFLSLSHSLDLPFTVIEGGRLPPSQRLSLREMVSMFLRLWQTPRTTAPNEWLENFPVASIPPSTDGSTALQRPCASTSQAIALHMFLMFHAKLQSGLCQFDEKINQPCVCKTRLGHLQLLPGRLPCPSFGMQRTLGKHLWLQSDKGHAI